MMVSMILVPEKWDKRKFIVPSILLMGFFSFLLGPSRLLHLQNSSTIIAVGLFLCGTCRGITMGICSSDAIEAGIKKFPDNEAKVSDYVASIYNFFFGFNTFIFPIVSSALV